MELQPNDTHLVIASDGVSSPCIDSFNEKLNISSSWRPIVIMTVPILTVFSLQLWDVITGQNAMKLIDTESHSEEAAKKLLDTVLQSPKSVDNVTIIVAFLS